MSQSDIITSIKDEKIVRVRLLQTAAGRLNASQCLLEGIEQIFWALESPLSIEYVLVHDKQRENPLLEKLRQNKIPLYFATDGILKKATDTGYLIPFVGVATCPKLENERSGDIVVVLDGVSDFGNLGTIVRTASAFQIREFISTDDKLDFFYKKTIDASRGTVFTSSLKRFASGCKAVEYLKEKGYQIAVTTPHKSVIQSFAKIEQKPIAIVLGNETHGVSPEVAALADVKIQIPMSGDVESLNVGVAAGISLYELKIKWVLTMLNQAIHQSIGRHLFAASRCLRLVFDHKLKEVSPFNADQAIMMMMLKCDKESTPEILGKDSGVLEAAQLLKPLIEQGYILDINDKVRLSEKGEEALAKIWPVHELSEQIAFKGLSEKEKETFLKAIEKIYENCGKIIPY